MLNVKNCLPNVKTSSKCKEFSFIFYFRKVFLLNFVMRLEQGLEDCGSVSDNLKVVATRKRNSATCKPSSKKRSSIASYLVRKKQVNISSALKRRKSAYCI
jgi:hypothetical protein